MPVLAQTGDWSGYLATEYRAFFNDGLVAEQDNQFAASIAYKPEYVNSWQQGRRLFRFSPYVRFDQFDSERTHFDIRELSYEHASRLIEWRIGIRKVFWGVTESQHLVDIINQTDLVESLDGEEKLGQPMINLALIQDWGTLDLFILTGFRERTFPGENGRFRTIPVVNTDRSEYESTKEDRHIDLALRWSHSLGDWDMGLAYFHGTNRDPRLVPQLNNSNIELIPFYDIIEQMSLDLQATKGSWLWKLEAIRRLSDVQDYSAATAGFEYSFFDLFGSGIDLGLVSEYLFDDRDEQATTPFEDDLMFGLRLAINDTQSTEALVGMIEDIDTGARIFSLEGSRRLTDQWKLSVEGSIFQNIDAQDLLGSIRQDDYVQVEIAYYF